MMETLGIKNVSIVLPPILKVEAKEKILQGAETLFMRYGIKTITMDDIAKDLAVSKKTIYQYFPDKDALVHELMAEKLKEDERDFKAVVQKASNVIDELFGYMKLMTTIFSTVNPVVFYDMQKYHPKSWQLFEQFKTGFIYNMVEESIERGKKQGLVRTDINAKIIARLRVQEIELGFNPLIFPPDKYKILDVQLAFIEHFLYGICTLKGHKQINKLKHIIEEE
jgi:AcrR family transcriptional regulator